MVPDWVLIPVANHNSAIFSVPQVLKSLTSSPLRQTRSLIIPTCFPCLALLLISEQPTDTSKFLVKLLDVLTELKCHKTKLHKM